MVACLPRQPTQAPEVCATHADTPADVAALDGKHVAGQVVEYVTDGQWADSVGARIVADPPLRWVAPTLLRPGTPPARDRLLAWTDALQLRPHVRVIQDGAVRARRTLPWPAAPGRIFRIPASMLDAANPTGGDIHIQISS